MHIVGNENCCSLFELTGVGYDERDDEIFIKRFRVALAKAFRRYGKKYGIIYTNGGTRGGDVYCHNVLIAAGFKYIEFSGRADFHGGTNGWLHLYYRDLKDMVDEPDFVDKYDPKPEPNPKACAYKVGNW